EVALLSRRRIQTVSAQKGHHQSRLGEVSTEAIGFVGPRNADVHGKTLANAPGIGGKEAIDIQETVLPQAPCDQRPRSYAGLKTPQRKPQNVIEFQECSG